MTKTWSFPNPDQVVFVPKANLTDAQRCHKILTTLPTFILIEGGCDGVIYDKDGKSLTAVWGGVSVFVSHQVCSNNTSQDFSRPVCSYQNILRQTSFSKPNQAVCVPKLNQSMSTVFRRDKTETLQHTKLKTHNIHSGVWGCKWQMRRTYHWFSISDRLFSHSDKKLIVILFLTKRISHHLVPSRLPALTWCMVGQGDTFGSKCCENSKVQLLLTHSALRLRAAKATGTSSSTACVSLQ